MHKRGSHAQPPAHLVALLVFSFFLRCVGLADRDREVRASFNFKGSISGLFFFRMGQFEAEVT